MTTFEEAYARLEHILEKMNSGAVSLDDSIKLYEEADKLIQLCQGKLTEAEQKIEVLIKNRDGTLAVSPQGELLKQDFNRTRETALT
jgi:exodeoxyribonuclease VII small subunit